MRIFLDANILFSAAKSNGAIRQLLADPRIEVRGVQYSSVATASTLWLPEKDRPALLAAIACGCEALVTGDRTHFGWGYGKTFDAVKIYSPALLAQAAWGRGKVG